VRTVLTSIGTAALILSSCGQPDEAAESFAKLEISTSNTLAAVDDAVDIAEIVAIPERLNVRCPPGPTTPEMMGDRFVVENLDDLQKYVGFFDAVIIGRVVATDESREFSFPEEVKELGDRADRFSIAPLQYEVLEYLAGDAELKTADIVTVSIPDNVVTGDACIDSRSPVGSLEIVFMNLARPDMGQQLDDINFNALSRLGLGGEVVNAYVPGWLEGAPLDGVDQMNVVNVIEAIRNSE